MKSILFTYLTILILLAVLQINGTNSILNNNYLLNIRWDYLLHALVYIPLIPLILLTLKRQETINKEQQAQNAKQKNLIIIITSLIFAFSLEAIQYFSPYRAFNINDLIANGIGVGLGMLLFSVAKTHNYA